MSTATCIIIIAAVVAQWIWTRGALWRTERALFYVVLHAGGEVTPLQLRDWIYGLSGRRIALAVVYAHLEAMMDRGDVERLEVPGTEARGGNKGYAYRLSIAALAAEAARG